MNSASSSSFTDSSSGGQSSGFAQLASSSQSSQSSSMDQSVAVETTPTLPRWRYNGHVNITSPLAANSSFKNFSQNTFSEEKPSGSKKRTKNDTDNVDDILGQSKSYILFYFTFL
jgi:hypothetical protein